MLGSTCEYIYAPEQSDKSEPPVIPDLQRLQFSTFYDLLSPIIKLLEKHKTFQLSKVLITESYREFRDLWRDADIRWNFTSPLLNFASDVKQEVAISDFIQLTPFSTREKTERWNYHSYAMLEIAVESIPLSSPLRL